MSRMRATKSGLIIWRSMRMRRSFTSATARAPCEGRVEELTSERLEVLQQVFLLGRRQRCAVGVTAAVVPAQAGVVAEACLLGLRSAGDVPDLLPVERVVAAEEHFRALVREEERAQ